MASGDHWNVSITDSMPVVGLDVRVSNYQYLRSLSACMVLSHSAGMLQTRVTEILENAPGWSHFGNIFTQLSGLFLLAHNFLSHEFCIHSKVLHHIEIIIALSK